MCRLERRTPGAKAQGRAFSCIYEGNARVSAWKRQERGSRWSMEEPMPAEAAHCPSLAKAKDLASPSPSFCFLPRKGGDRAPETRQAPRDRRRLLARMKTGLRSKAIDPVNRLQVRTPTTAPASESRGKRDGRGSDGLAR